MPTSPTIRPAPLAGSWYPDSETGCHDLFDSYGQDAVDSGRSRLRAGIVPHAGWMFSGAIAYNVFRELARRAGPVDTIALFAGHLSARSRPSLMTSGDCWTPLGPIPTDKEMAREIARRFEITKESANEHSQDNSAEVQFPMLKHFFGDARLLILGAPPRPEVLDLADVVIEVAERLGRRILAIASTDLTHYGPQYRFTPQGVGSKAERWVRDVNDPLFIDAACTGSPDHAIETALHNHNACCPGATAAAMRCAEHLGQSKGERLRYATSADIRPDSSFVGYTGIVY
jgi:AmmeMemoRadiSam system protein B